MAQRVKAGDVFQVQLDAATVKYFQYVGDDLEQLNSQVVRAFRETYDASASVDVERATAGVVDFHAHVFLRNGLKQGYWRRVGHTNPPDTADVLFRDSGDCGYPEVKVSHDWYVWNINGPSKRVGKLQPQYQHAEIGVVVPADSLVHRMKEGTYDFVYPDY